MVHVNINKRRNQRCDLYPFQGDAPVLFVILLTHHEGRGNSSPWWQITVIEGKEGWAIEFGLLYIEWLFVYSVLLFG